MTLRRLAYNVLLVPAFLVLLPRYLARMFRRGGWRPGFLQRFGLYPKTFRTRLATEEAAEKTGRIWIQAVSVGEVLVALKLIAALRRRAASERRSSPRFLLSTTTTTGHALALPHAGPDLEVLYTPLDFPPCARWAWRALRPAALVVVEGGLWPNLLAQAKAAGRPVLLVNARLSPRSERRFRLGRALAAPLLFEPLALVAAPEPGDVARWTSVGVAPPEKVHVVGNVKFDDEPPGAAPVGSLASELTASGWPVDDPDRPVLLLASTHPGEEALLARTFLELRGAADARFPDLRLVVVPRHVERAAAVADELRALGLRVAKRTGLLRDAPSNADTLLLDTTGELRTLLPFATVVVMGKCWLSPGMEDASSVVPSGGQNPVEPLLAGRPVVVGPRMENFAEITAALVVANAAVQVSDAGGLLRGACARLLSDPAEREAQVQNAAAVLARHRGATDRTAELILRVLPGNTSGPA